MESWSLQQKCICSLKNNEFILNISRMEFKRESCILLMDKDNKIALFKNQKTLTLIPEQAGGQGYHDNFDY